MSQHNFKRDQSMACKQGRPRPFTYFIEIPLCEGQLVNLSLYYKEANLPLWCLSSRHPLFVMFNKESQSEPQCFIKTDSFVTKTSGPKVKLYRQPPVCYCGQSPSSWLLCWEHDLFIPVLFNHHTLAKIYKYKTLNREWGVTSQSHSL